MKFSPKCRARKLGMICTILRSFCSFCFGEGHNIRPQIWPRKIPVYYIYMGERFQDYEPHFESKKGYDKRGILFIVLFLRGLDDHFIEATMFISPDPK